MAAHGEPAGPVDPRPRDAVIVNRPRRMRRASLPAERIPLGVPGDYKPCVARLASGELLLVAFHQHRLEAEAIREELFFYRSADGGRTWSARLPSPMLGREPYLTVLSDGVILMTAHHLKQDVRNPYGHGYALLHRSADGGMTWRTVPIPNTEVPGAPSDDWVVTSRNVLERPDGSLWLGVSASRGRDFLWRSLDRGATWDRTRQSQCAGVDPTLLWWPFWAETVLWQTRAGDALGLWRVDPRVVPRLPGSDVPDYTGDNVERLVVYRARDDGRRWTREPELGSWYGEMYPALLRLRDGRLLCTFTVRALGRPLGVQAVLGDELPDGFRFDFAYDRLILDIRTPTNASSSGGGFGPTVQPDDATLVTAYSWRDAEDQTHLEAVRWPVPE